MFKKQELITNIFKNNEIRAVWDQEKEDYYFSVVDVIKALTESSKSRDYWSDLKKKLITEWSKLYEKILQFKMIAPDGKLKLTDILDTKENNLNYQYQDENLLIKNKTNKKRNLN